MFRNAFKLCRVFAANRSERTMATARANESSLIRVNGMDRIPKPFLIGVAGGTASGKVCYVIIKKKTKS